MTELNLIPVKITELSLSPEHMKMEVLREIPEQRICAAIGIPPDVLGLNHPTKKQKPILPVQ